MEILRIYSCRKDGGWGKKGKKEATLWPMMMLQMALVAPAYSEVADEGGGCGLVRALRAAATVLWRMMTMLEVYCGCCGAGDWMPPTAAGKETCPTMEATVAGPDYSAPTSQGGQDSGLGLQLQLRLRLDCG